MSMSKRPAISIIGFADHWEQRKIGEVASFSKGSGYSKADILDKGIPLILYGRLYTKYETIIHEVDTFAIPKEGSVYSRGNEVIVPASGESAEDISIASVVEKAGFLIGGDLNIITPGTDIDPAFLALSISHGKTHYALSKLAQGKSVVHIHNSDIQSVDLRYPKKAEQQQISRYFIRLDNLIALHQRKYDKLLTYKKAMLEKLFPKDGEDVPEVRFAGFSGEWKVRKVSDLLIERNEQAPQSKDYPLMAFIAYEGVAPKGERYDRSSLVNDVENKLYKRTEKGDFIYSSNNLETGSIGLNNYGNASISPVYSIFSTTKLGDSDFINQRFTRKDFIVEMVKWRQGVIYGQWRIHENDFLKIEVLAPSVEEQSKIGCFLRSLDNLIHSYQRKIASLKRIKAALLEKMFI